MIENAAQRSLVLHAPNVHTGGGLVLLRALMQAPNFAARWLQCDARVQGKLPAAADVTYVRPSIVSRLLAECRLARRSRAEDLILCFHNLPPLFRCRGEVVVYVQNRLLVGETARGFPLRVRLRLMVERAWLRALKHHAARYLVQTPDMQTSLQRRLGPGVAIEVFPFIPTHQPSARQAQQYDFTYIASGEAHKNHEVLLAAWQLLADAGKRPSLALTIDPVQYPKLAGRIAQANGQGLAITNLGNTPAATIYPISGALLYPSLSESFGLPLIEAAQHGLPILAAALPYVHAVADPVATFDPARPETLAAAVERFLADPLPAPAARSMPSAAELLRYLGVGV